MNTLKFKALLKMSTTLFLKSLLAYSILTLPALIIWPMYVYSLFYAATFGWIAWLLLLISLIILTASFIGRSYFSYFTLVFVYAGIVIGYVLIATLLFDFNPLYDHTFILFPLAALIAASFCLIKYKKKIEEEIIFHRQILAVK
jgi:hypothetical protein